MSPERFARRFVRGPSPLRAGKLAKRARQARGMLFSLPDELLHVLSAELDAAAACRLSHVDKAMLHLVRLHARDRHRVYAWRHAWLMLCERAKARVLHRRAGRRGRVSVVWNHFARVGAAPVGAACAPVGALLFHREGIANGNACGVQLTTRSTAPLLWNHLLTAHPMLYTELRACIPDPRDP